MVSCIRNINFLKYPHRTIKCRNYANYNLVNLVNDAQNINWSRILENNSDVNAAVNYLTAQLKTLFDSHAPIVEKRVKGKPYEWLDDTVKKEMNKRDQLLWRARKLNDESIWREYKKQRNKCNNGVKKAKASYHHRVRSTAIDPQSWLPQCFAIKYEKKWTTENSLDVYI